jgi:hypothetical protein
MRLVSVDGIGEGTGTGTGTDTGSGGGCWEEYDICCWPKIQIILWHN